MSKKNNILLNTIIVQGKGNFVSDMDGEKVMLSIHNGKYYNLGEMGGQIWEVINVPVSVHHLINALTAEYDVDPTECENQVISFLELLYEEDLIQVGEEVKQVLDTAFIQTT